MNTADIWIGIIIPIFIGPICAYIMTLRNDYVERQYKRRREKYSEKKAKIFRVSPFLITITQKVVSFFQDSLNVAERLAFAEVTSSGESLDADMSKTYEILDLKKEDMTSLESYIKEYYQQILKRVKEMEADLNIEEKKRLPF